MSVTEAVQRDIEAIRKRDPALADSTLAALALSLAGLIDDPKASATSKSMNAHQLRDTTVKLRELAPPEKVRDSVDDLRDDLAALRSTKAEDRPHTGDHKKRRPASS